MTASTEPKGADTIVFIHGLWMTPRSWEQPHFPGAPGWEDAADYAFDWAAANAKVPQPA